MLLISQDAALYHVSSFPTDLKFIIEDGSGDCTYQEFMAVSNIVIFFAGHLATGDDPASRCFRTLGHISLWILVN